MNTPNRIPYPLLLWVLVLGTACAQRETSSGPAVVGQPAPRFEFLDQSGARRWLTQYRGKVVLVNFWATWCLPCKEEMPSIEALYKQTDRSQFAILALSVDESWIPVRRFMAENGFTMPISADFGRKAATLFGTTKFPETYILDKRGIVAQKIIGPTDWMAPQMVDFLKKLMEAGS